jgi:hypothetical protein
MDEQGLTELHAFSSLVSQVKRVVEDIYWVYATACTAHDSKTRMYFLERFNKPFLDNAQKVVQMADAAQVVVVTSQEALADIKKWLNCQRMSTTNLDPNLLLVLDRPCPVHMGDEERKYVTTMLGQITATSAPSLDLLQTLRVENFIRTSTKLYLGKVVASYTHEVVWAQHAHRWAGRTQPRPSNVGRTGTRHASDHHSPGIKRKDDTQARTRRFEHWLL